MNKNRWAFAFAILIIFSFAVFVFSVSPILNSVGLSSSSGNNYVSDDLMFYVNGSDDTNMTYHGYWYVNDSVVLNKEWRADASSGVQDRMETMVLDSDNNVYVGGYFNKASRRCKIQKYNPVDGSLVYEIGSFYGALNLCNIKDLDVDPYQNVYACGYGYNGSNYNWFVVKYNSTGGELWNYTYLGNNANFYGCGVSLDSSGNVYYVGDDDGVPNNDWLIVKLNSTGGEVWNNTWSSGSLAFDNAFDVDVDSDDDFYVLGRYNNGSWVLRVAKYNSTGAQLWDFNWTAPYGSLGSYIPEGTGILEVDENKNLYVSGYIDDSGYQDGFGLKISSFGNLVWNVSYSRDDNLDQLFYVNVDSYNNPYFASLREYGVPSGGYIIKYNQDGERVFSKNITGQPKAISIGSDNNIYVSTIFNNITSSDQVWTTYKFDNGFILENQSSGQVLLNTLSSGNTSVGDNWSACAVVYNFSNYSLYSSRLCSGNLTILSDPVVNETFQEEEEGEEEPSSGGSFGAVDSSAVFVNGSYIIYMGEEEDYINQVRDVKYGYGYYFSFNDENYTLELKSIDRQKEVVSFNVDSADYLLEVGESVNLTLDGEIVEIYLGYIGDSSLISVRFFSHGFVEVLEEEILEELVEKEDVRSSRLKDFFVNVFNLGSGDSGEFEGGFGRIFVSPGFIFVILVILVLAFVWMSRRRKKMNK